VVGWFGHMSGQLTLLIPIVGLCWAGYCWWMVCVEGLLIVSLKERDRPSVSSLCFLCGCVKKLFIWSSFFVDLFSE
jgi:hypothetical protein